MVGRHHRLSGREFEQTPGGSEGQGSLACYSQPMGLQRVGRDLAAEERHVSDVLQSERRAAARLVAHSPPLRLIMGHRV